MTIPKVIHYVWVGPKPLTPLAKKCIESWKEYLPEYELKLWNEGNSPMDHPYVKAMYANKKWAFVADYIRFWALEREGGIYLDTDTEVLKSFNSLLQHDVFFGKTKDGYTAAGVIGAQPQSKCIGDILEEYNSIKDYSKVRTSPQIVTDVLSKKSCEEVKVYDYQYFNPCDDGEKCTQEKLKVAYTNNHWAESWVSFARLRKALRRLGVFTTIKAIRNIFRVVR